MRGFTPQEEARYQEDLQEARRYYEHRAGLDIAWAKFRLAAAQDEANARMSIALMKIGEMLDAARRLQHRNQILLLCAPYSSR